MQAESPFSQLSGVVSWMMFRYSVIFAAACASVSISGDIPILAAQRFFGIFGVILLLLTFICFCIEVGAKLQAHFAHLDRVYAEINAFTARTQLLQPVEPKPDPQPAPIVFNPVKTTGGFTARRVDYGDKTPTVEFIRFAYETAMAHPRHFVTERVAMERFGNANDMLTVLEKERVLEKAFTSDGNNAPRRWRDGVGLQDALVTFGYPSVTIPTSPPSTGSQ